MSDNSRIEWTDATWNPTTGCTKVSPGCDRCYAEGIFNRFNGPGAFDTVTLRPERLGQPLRWRKARRVFVNSMSDLFHEAIPDEFIAEVFGVMSTCASHTFQILTKRHGRMRSLLGTDRFRGMVLDHHLDWMVRAPGRCQNYPDTWPLPNVWLGVSVEDQKWADIRIPALVETPAAVRFLSCEPLLGPVDLGAVPPRVGGIPAIHWVIVGAESGRGARQMAEQWARDIKDQCVDAGVAFFLKQYADNGRKVHLPQLDGQQWTEYPQAAALSRVSRETE